MLLYDWHPLGEHGTLPPCGVRDCPEDAYWVVIEDEPDDMGRFIGRLLCGRHFQPVYDKHMEARHART